MTIETPTDWCSHGLVIKKSGHVRICADLKRSSQCVKRLYKFDDPHVGKPFSLITMLLLCLMIVCPGWKCSICLVSFKVDTGEDSTVISKFSYHLCKNCLLLMVNKTILNSLSGRPPVAASFTGVIQKYGEKYKFNVFVIDSAPKNNLLRQNVSHKLGVSS